MKRKADDSSDSTNLDGGSKSHINVEKVLSVIRDGVAEFDAPNRSFLQHQDDSRRKGRQSKR
jgi:hypothetical protein